LRMMNNELRFPLRGLMKSGTLVERGRLIVKSGPMPDWRRTKPIFCDRGWRISGVCVSGKRTIPQGESRLIKPNQGEIGSRRGLRIKLGHEVGECVRVHRGGQSCCVRKVVPQIMWMRKGRDQRFFVPQNDVGKGQPPSAKSAWPGKDSHAQAVSVDV